MNDVKHFLIPLSMLLLACVAAVVGALVAIRPNKWFQLINWWNRHVLRLTATSDVFSSEVLYHRFHLLLLRIAGLGILIAALVFASAVTRAIVVGLGSNQATGNQISATEVNLPRAFSWPEVVIGLVFLVVGVSFLWKPIATIRRISPRMFSAEAFSDPRARSGLRIFGAAVVLWAIVALWKSVSVLF